MATIQGTSGKDKGTVNSGDTYNALEGDDDITLMQGATVNPGAGNDVIRVMPGLVRDQATVQLWSAPGNIYVDLEAGYALPQLRRHDWAWGFLYQFLVAPLNRAVALTKVSIIPVFIRD